jgi:hypothetical protein
MDLEQSLAELSQQLHVRLSVLEDTGARQTDEDKIVLVREIRALPEKHFWYTRVGKKLENLHRKLNEFIRLPECNMHQMQMVFTPLDITQSMINESHVPLDCIHLAQWTVSFARLFHEFHSSLYLEWKQVEGCIWPNEYDIKLWTSDSKLYYPNRVNNAVLVARLETLRPVMHRVGKLKIHELKLAGWTLEKLEDTRKQLGTTDYPLVEMVDSLMTYSSDSAIAIAPGDFVNGIDENMTIDDALKRYRVVSTLCQVMQDEIELGSERRKAKEELRRKIDKFFYEPLPHDNESSYPTPVWATRRHDKEL